jgi:hypothetical protein
MDDRTKLTGSAARQAEPPGDFVIVPEADLDHRLAAVRRARLTNQVEDWNEAGFPLKVRAND